jgi:hypothetical protein
MIMFAGSVATLKVHGTQSAPNGGSGRVILHVGIRLCWFVISLMLFAELLDVASRHLACLSTIMVCGTQLCMHCCTPPPLQQQQLLLTPVCSNCNKPVTVIDEDVTANAAAAAAVSPWSVACQASTMAAAASLAQASETFGAQHPTRDPMPAAFWRAAATWPSPAA